MEASTEANRHPGGKARGNAQLFDQTRRQGFLEREEFTCQGEEGRDAGHRVRARQALGSLHGP